MTGFFLTDVGKRNQRPHSTLGLIMLEPEKVSESEFFMWRAVFAFAFVDSSLSLEEQELLYSYLAKARLSSEQKNILKKDLLEPQDTEQMYRGITSSHDKERFCVLARALAWCEGDLDAQEVKILKKVSCLKHGEENEYLQKSRSSAHLHDFYQHYARSGVVGLVEYPKRVELSY